MKIISIDTGYERLGIAIIEKTKGGKETLLFSECFKTSPKDEHCLRLSQIHTRIEYLIGAYYPEALAIENLFFNTNQKTAILVAEARGVILALAALSGISAFEYSPPQIKLSVTGYGKSDKNQIMKMIPMLIDIDKEITSDDEFDAIAVGLTYFAHNRVV